MSKWAQGVYQVINTKKYVGQGMPRYRSGWEHSFMRFCDTNDNIMQWASESIRIPYLHPLTGKMTTYVPDFLITYKTRDNTLRAELIEIKPPLLLKFINRKQELTNLDQSMFQRGFMPITDSAANAVLKPTSQK